MSPGLRVVMRDHTGTPVAVVAGADHATGLGSGRALSRAGAEVWGVAGSTSTPSCKSRVWRQLHGVTGGDDAWFPRLQEVATRLDRPAFLLPSQDFLVAEMSRRRDELDDAYRFVLPPHATLQLLLEKTRFHAWGQARGLPLPESHIVSTEPDLRAALRDMPYPLLVKPSYRSEAWERESPVRKSILLRSAEDFAQVRFDLFAAVSSYLVSRWIDGPDSSVHYCLAYCDRSGHMSASFTGRKLLQFPRLTGSTAVCVGTDNAELRELTQEVFRLAGFEGMGSLEVKYGADAKPYITEPTVGRPNLQSYSAVASGCNLHAVAMADALNVDPEPYRGSHRNLFWVQEERAIDLFASRRTLPIPWRLLGVELLRAARVGGAVFAWRDPAPAAVLFWKSARSAGGWLFRRITGIVRPEGPSGLA